MMIRILSLTVACSLTVQSLAAPTPGTWTDVGSVTALGSVGGIGITATTTQDAEFTEAATHRFTNVNVLCGGWDIEGFELPISALALTTTNVNGGDYQQFDFDVPWQGGYFYIENFDSSSLATITVTGEGAKLDLLAASPSVSYVGSTVATGILSSSNAGYNGEGDAVFSIMGDVTSIRVDYEQGEGANGIFYGFADVAPAPPIPSPVPEPTSLLLWSSLVSMILVVQLKRRE